MTKISYEAQLTAGILDVEDGGAARILTVDHPDDECFFVRLQSWDETGQHDLLKKLEGKRIRITIETLE